MSGLRAIIGANLRNILQSGALVMVFAGIAVICAAVVAVIAGSFIFSPAVEDGDTTATELGNYLGLISYATTVIITGASFTVLFTVPLLREKTRGTLESLLATPVSVRQVWTARSVALFVPGAVIGGVLGLGMMLFLMTAYLSDVDVVVNGYLVVATFVVVPLIYLALSALMHLVGLLGRVTSGNVIAVIFLPGFSSVMLRLAGRAGVDVESWPFLTINIACGLVLFMLIMIFRHKLTKERIVLSCHS
ncbi:ABC transporter permease [Phytoactinopolyspora halophila]|uniref:ABC transporter permease n=1 Tax=Phytoactinopolyspora halophila TaxID=1981511 RepID=UPI001314D390|nr:ABC transporter permease [Phytoactinopolyspora halophila]